MSVAAGSWHTLTLDDNGDVWSFGRNFEGQCGINTNGNNVKIPTKVHGLKDIVFIATGSDFSACVDVEGHLWTFGKNDKGQLGHGDTKNRCTPTRVEGLESIVSVCAGFAHSLCVTSYHKVYGFGFNHAGQLGIGRNVESELSPVLVPLDVDIKQIACGGNHSVFLTCDGDVWVCGSNLNSELGLVDFQNRNTPAKNPYLNDIVSVQCGGDHTILMNSKHQLFGFGNNEFEQLCRIGDDAYKPEPIQFSEDVKSFTCGDTHTRILDTSNRLWVFGLFGEDIELELLDGYEYSAMLSEPSDVCFVSSGGYHLLMKTTSNEIWVYGLNDQYQLALPISKQGKTIRKPQRIPAEYNHIFGTPIDRSKSTGK